MAYTISQEKVVFSRGSNLLVSAAAGSGKTFVLTGHVVNRITEKDPAEQIDVDRMLIITFTKAAALEMKQRIEKAINEQLEKNPSDGNLLRQRALITNAHISTIDSFFAWVVKTYFDKSLIDPEYRTEDCGQMELLEREVFEKVFEETMSLKNRDFEEFLDAYIDEKNIRDSLFSLVNNNYKTISSVSDTDAFYTMLEQSCRSDYKSIDEIPLTKELLNYYKHYFSSIAQTFKAFSEDPELEKYYEYNCDVADFFLKASEPDDFETMLEVVRRSDDFISKYPSKKRNEETTERKEYYISFRKDTYLPFFKEFKNSFLNDGIANMLFAVNSNGRRIHAYLEFFKKYNEELFKEKIRNNVMAFSDISHEAYRIIHDNPDVAAELSEKFKLVIVDEYQDTNPLQEDTLALFADHNNYYMIGDIKQSIYGFRNASPEIFASKYNTFGDSGSDIKIELSENFRSRKNVLDAVNSVFERIMFKEVCGITYDDGASLKYGAKDIYDKTSSSDYDTELLIYNSEGNASEYRPAQSQIIVNKIRELISSGHVVDKDGNAHKAAYRDIAVLSRNFSSIKNLTDALDEADIPYTIDEKRGFFESNEVQLILSVLRVIDNPYQNQYMLAVLTSPLAGFSDNAIAELVGDFKARKKDNDDISLYECVTADKNDMCVKFITQLDAYRKYSKHHGVYELIDKILFDTDYLYYLSSLPDNETRLANIELLSQKARDFELASFSGIFDFINYIDRFIKNKGDQKNSNTASESDDAVRIMTIHSSKGLEFPIVFLNNCGNNLYKTAKSAHAVQLESFGVCAPYVDLDNSVKIKTLPMLAASLIKKNTELAEEMRLLYVAMTRAREKLYLVAHQRCSEDDPKIEINNILAEYFKGFYPEFCVRKCSSYLDLILLSFNKSNPNIRHTFYTKNDIKKSIAVYRRNSQQLIDEMNKGSADDYRETDLYRHIGSMTSNYKPHSMKAAYSVSELKLAAAQEYIPEEPAVQVLTAQIDGLGGAELGSAYHLVMEKVEPAKAKNDEYVSSVIDRLSARGLIDSITAEKIRPGLISAFFKHKLAERILKADEAGMLSREHEFVLSLPAGQIDEDAGDMDVPVIVQGVIDMFFIEDGRIVIIDYKTDRILPGQESILTGHYKKQLELYARALSAHFGLPVSEKYLYSFALESFIPA